MSYDAFRIFDDEWAKLEELASEHDRRSADANNTRSWRKGFNLTGAAGELCYQLVSRYPMSTSLEIRDGGEDFPGIDVKASTYWGDPHLKHPLHDPLKAPFYFLTAVDLENRLVRPIGYATRPMLKAAPVVDYGNGPTLSLRADELLAPDVLIPRIIDGARKGYQW